MDDPGMLERSVDICSVTLCVCQLILNEIFVTYEGKIFSETKAKLCYFQRQQSSHFTRFSSNFGIINMVVCTQNIAAPSCMPALATASGGLQGGLQHCHYLLIGSQWQLFNNQTCYELFVYLIINV